MKAILFPALLLYFSGSCAQALLKISPLTGNLYVFTTYRSLGEDRVPANGLYAVTGKGVVMSDTPGDTTQFQPLLDSIKTRHGEEVVLCIATHSHEDRTGGLEFLRERGVKTYTSALTDRICQEKGEKRAEFRFMNDTVFRYGEYSFETYYGGEGHSPDNIVIWIGKEKVLYGGCLIKSTEAQDLGYVGEANLKAWPQTIKSIMKKFPHPVCVIPGHQSWTDKASPQHTLKLLKRETK
jgi:metallo-beta-lactamase class B